jgi:hypothetical protein
MIGTGLLRRAFWGRRRSRLSSKDIFVVIRHMALLGQPPGPPSHNYQVGRGGSPNSRAQYLSYLRESSRARLTNAELCLPFDIRR